jgi:molybdopterin-guanine dinucleotide biosynthesis protein A
MSTSTAPIYALVLAGGRSTRMQRDKAALSYHGRTQLEWAVSLLQPHAQRVFASWPRKQNIRRLRGWY